MQHNNPLFKNKLEFNEENTVNHINLVESRYPLVIGNGLLILIATFWRVFKQFLYVVNKQSAEGDIK